MLLLVMVSTWCSHRKLKRIKEMITWQFVVICGLPYFREKMGVFVVIKNKSKIWRNEDGKKEGQILLELKFFHKILQE